MVNYTFNQTEIKTVWKHTKNKRYSIRSFINHGSYVKYIIFDDKQSGRKCTGKVVTKFFEGEVYHWPRLQHNSLSPLLDIIYIDERLGIYMTSHLTDSLRDTIHNDSFVNDPLNFDRKKAYIADILWGVDYMHSKNLSLMNISDANVFVCTESDKAVIADFTCLVLFQNAAKHRKCVPYMYRAPELSAVTPFAKKNDFNPISTNIWSLGVMAMDIFLNHSTPWGLVDYDPSRAPDVLTEINCDMLKVANKGSSINNQDVDDLKQFLALFLDINPRNRSPPNKSVLKNFIQIGKYRAGAKIDNFSIQSKKKQRKVGDSDKTDFSTNKPVVSSSIKSNKISYQSKYIPDINIRSHKHLKELPDANGTRPKFKNSAKSSDQSNGMKGERIYCETDSLCDAEEPYVTYGAYNTKITPKRQIARLNEIQEAATNLSIKLCRYYKELEDESNANKKNLVNDSKYPEEAPLHQIENFRELQTKESNSFTQINNTPKSNEQENGDYSSDTMTESNDSFSDSVCLFKRFSEPKKKLSVSKRNFKLFRASAPALQNVLLPLKKCDSQQIKNHSTQWEDGHTPSSIKTDDSKCVIEGFHERSAQLANVSREETVKESMHDNNPIFDPFDADKLKISNITSKNKLYNNTWNMKAWTEETNTCEYSRNTNGKTLDDREWSPNLRGLNDTNEESFGLNHLFNSNTPNTPLHFNSVSPRFFNAQPRQIKIAKRRQKESNNKSMNKVNESHLNKSLNEIETYNYIAKQKFQNKMEFMETVNVASTKSNNKNEAQSKEGENASKKGYSTHTLKCKNKNQFNQTANIAQKDNLRIKPKSENGANLKVNVKDKLSTKQKCEVSRVLLKVDGNETVGNIYDLVDHKSKPTVAYPTGHSQQHTNADVEAKKKKEKKTTCFCFSKK